MIIYPDQGAGMCNRLHAAANLIAHSEMSGNPLLLCSLRKYNRYFDGLPDKGIFAFSPTEKRAVRFRKPFSFLRSGVFPTGAIHFNDPVVKRAEEAALMVLVGWRFRDTEALLKHGDLVRSIFVPTGVYSEVISRKVVGAREGADNLVGVHIRRGDYKSYRDGVLYYDDEIYTSAMRLVVNNLKGKTRFLVASDEPIDPGSFGGCFVVAAPGHELEDLYCLAGCDYIIGPSSTYSAWAAFYGNAPLWQFDRDAVRDENIVFKKVSGTR
ncbi:MAG: hypothetical protein M0P27_01555 [Bacteroidales bacterium]|nr:hypothetical protein [Bacteroidales bacterium]